jgi:hypothetical protein
MNVGEHLYSRFIMQLHLHSRIATHMFHMSCHGSFSSSAMESRFALDCCHDDLPRLCWGGQLCTPGVDYLWASMQALPKSGVHTLLAAPQQLLQMSPTDAVAPLLGAMAKADALLRSHE